MAFSGIGVLLASQVLSIFAVIVFLGGLANMQRSLNNLQLFAANVDQTSLTRYNNSFRGALLVNYAGHTGRQFGYQWWYFSYEFVLILWSFIICGLNIGVRHMATSATQALLAVALSMGIYITNSTLFFHYSADAQALFGNSAINALLSGSIILCVANFVSIIALACAMPRPATYDQIVATHTRPKTLAEEQTATAV